ncbi:MAG: hypothetical protein ACK4IY_01165 [Chitinophagales bacterium]
MRKIFLLLTLSLSLIVFKVCPAFAQSDFPTATFGENMQLTLSAEAPLSPFYTVDISSIAFKDAAGADRFFRSLTDNLVRATVNYDAKEATIQLMVAYAEGWDVSQWNNYFATVQARYQGAFEKFNN